MYIEQEHIGKTVKRPGASKSEGVVKSLHGMEFETTEGERYVRADIYGEWNVVEPKKKPSEVFAEEADKIPSLNRCGEAKKADWFKAVANTLDRLLEDK